MMACGATVYVDGHTAPINTGCMFGVWCARLVGAYQCEVPVLVYFLEIGFYEVADIRITP